MATQTTTHAQKTFTSDYTSMEYSALKAVNVVRDRDPAAVDSKRLKTNLNRSNRRDTDLHTAS